MTTWTHPLIILINITYVPTGLVRTTRRFAWYRMCTYQQGLPFIPSLRYYNQYNIAQASVCIHTCTYTCILYNVLQHLRELVESLCKSEGVLDIQCNGELVVEKLKELRDENQRKIQEQINLLRQESEAARSKVKYAMLGNTNNVCHTCITQSIISTCMQYTVESLTTNL